MEPIVSYEQVGGLLQRDEVSIDAAELQGLLCALLGSHPQLTLAGWVTAALGEPLTPGYLDDDAAALLGRVFEQTAEQLNEGMFGLRLLLPDDDADLAERTEALVHWGSGYLSGLGQLGDEDFAHWPDDAREFVTDLAEITKADFINADDTLDEEAFTELMEYARVGAMLVFETLRGASQDEAIRE